MPHSFHLGVKQKQKSPGKNTLSSDREFDEAFSLLCDPFLPARGHAMMALATLLQRKNPKALKNADTLLKIFEEQLTHDDSYIYLAAIQGLVALAAVSADKVIPHLAREFACCKENAEEKKKEAGAKDQGLYLTHKKGTDHKSNYEELGTKITLCKLPLILCIPSSLDLHRTPSFCLKKGSPPSPLSFYQDTFFYTLVFCISFYVSQDYMGILG